MPVLRRLGCSVLALGLLAGCAPPRTGPASSPTNNGAKADAVIRIVRDFMTQAHLKAVLVRVTVAGKEVVTRAVGDSMTGVPATTAIHFRNGAVAISYVATLLLKLVDEKKAAPGRQAVQVASRLSARRPGHAGSTSADDIRLPRLRPRQRGV